ncbi:hypothetical protein Tco_1074309, partial [Tanacetum coccineum]
MSQEQRQQAAHDESLVPSTDRVKNSATSMRIEPQCLKRKKHSKLKILDIYPRVPNEDIVVPPSEETLLTFLIELGYKGPLNHLARMFVDRMHQPWRTLARIINKSESDLEPARSTRKRSSGITFKDISSASKKKSPDKSQKLKGIQVLTEEEQLAADTIQAIKGSNMVPDGSIVIFTTSSEGTGITLGVPDEVKGSSEAKVDSAIDWGSENKSDYSDEAQVDEEEIKWVSTDEEEEKQDDQDDDDDRSIDIEETGDDEKIDDELVHSDEYVHNDVDEEMKDVEVVVTRKDDDEGSDAAKVDAKKTEEVKGDNKKVDLPPPSSSLLVSSGFSNQFLNLSSDIS